MLENEDGDDERDEARHRRTGSRPGPAAWSVEQAQHAVAAAAVPDLQADSVLLAKVTGRVLAESLHASGGGESALPAGTLLAATHLPLLAASGAPTANVFRRLRVGILTAGVDGAPAEAALAARPDRRLAGPVLVSLIETMGAQAIAAPHALGGERSLGPVLDMLLAECSLVLIAGCTTGPEQTAIERTLAARGAPPSPFRMQVQPAMDFGFARVGEKIVVLLPAGIASVFMAFTLFVSPLIRRLQGRREVFPSTTVAAASGLDAKAPKADRFDWATERVDEGGGTALLLSAHSDASESQPLESIGCATGLARVPAAGVSVLRNVVRYYAFRHWLH